MWQKNNIPCYKSTNLISKLDVLQSLPRTFANVLRSIQAFFSFRHGSSEMLRPRFNALGKPSRIHPSLFFPFFHKKHLNLPRVQALVTTLFFLYLKYVRKEYKIYFYTLHRGLFSLLRLRTTQCFQQLTDSNLGTEPICTIHIFPVFRFPNAWL